jgi:hypothetical protein
MRRRVHGLLRFARLLSSLEKKTVSGRLVPNTAHYRTQTNGCPKAVTLHCSSGTASGRSGSVSNNWQTSDVCAHFWGTCPGWGANSVGGGDSFNEPSVTFAVEPGGSRLCCEVHGPGSHRMRRTGALRTQPKGQIGEPGRLRRELLPPGFRARSCGEAHRPGLHFDDLAHLDQAPHVPGPFGAPLSGSPSLRRSLSGLIAGEAAALVTATMFLTFRRNPSTSSAERPEGLIGLG